MGIKQVIKSLEKNTKEYKAATAEKPKKKKDDAEFSDEQKRLEHELLRVKSEEEKKLPKNELEAIVQNGELASRGFEEAEQQHFEKQFEGIRAEYKQHDVINPNSEERTQDAYNAGHEHNEAHAHNQYHSHNHKSMYKNNDNGY